MPPTRRCTATSAAPPPSAKPPAQARRGRRGGARGAPPIRRRSSDDVGQQLAFELRDLILQQQLALLQPLQPELVERRPFRQSSDHVVEVAMLAAQLPERARALFLAL